MNWKEPLRERLMAVQAERAFQRKSSDALISAIWNAYADVTHGVVDRTICERSPNGFRLFDRAVTWARSAEDAFTVCCSDDADPYAFTRTDGAWHVAVGEGAPEKVTLLAYERFIYHWLTGSRPLSS